MANADGRTLILDDQPFAWIAADRHAVLKIKPYNAHAPAKGEKDYLDRLWADMTRVFTPALNRSVCDSPRECT